MLFLIIIFLCFTVVRASIAYTDILISSFTSDDGVILDSQTTLDTLGFSVKTAGDFNKDGYDDVIIGSYNALSGRGIVYIVFGSKNGLADKTLTSGFSAGQGMRIYGSSAEKFGYSVSYAGDVNKDGIDDVIIGGINYQFGKGVAWMIYGSENLPVSLDLSSGLASSQGFKITGPAGVSYFGASVSSAGDLNKDGIGDVIIGASGANSNEGAAHLWLNAADGFTILGPSATGYFGVSVGNAGDVDGDGIDDIIARAYGIATVYVIYGKDTSLNGAFSTIDLDLGLSLSQGFTITGSGQLGGSVGKAGDFNGDGKADVVIGAASEGAAYVIFGKARSDLVDMSVSPGISSTRGLKIKGGMASSAFAKSVSGAGDINGDGIGDIIIGAPQAASKGKAYVIFGSENLASEIDITSSFEGFSIVGASSGNQLGISVGTAGDVNGDGLKDLIVGAYGVNNLAGAAYLLFSPLVCPEKCDTCETFLVCSTCQAGLGLLGDNCVECPVATDLVGGKCIPKSSLLGTAAGVSKGLFDSGSTASRLFTMGRSLSVSLGLMGKIIQNVRFLDIRYPEEALTAFKTYGTDLFEMPIPETLYLSPDTKNLTSQYGRYDMEPSFLENYWNTILMILISLACFLVVALVQFLTKSQRKDHILQVALKNIGQTFANFFIVQIYANLDDVTFYLFLDIQNTKLDSASAGAGLGAGIVFLLFGLALVFFHCWLLGKYQKAKSKGDLGRFEEKHRILGTLYEDFKDDGIAKQFFFGVLILRCIILIIVITLLQPQWMQGALLMLTNLAFLGYFIYYRPFKSRFDEVVQYFCELTIFTAYLCVLILSIMDAQDIEKSSLRRSLGKCIVLSGIVLALGGFVVQMIQTFGVVFNICKFLKDYNKQKLQVKVFPSIDLSLSQTSENSGALISENSSILRQINPRTLADQLELIASSEKKNLKTPSPSKRFPFATHNLRISSLNPDTNPTLNRRIGAGKIKPYCKDFERLGQGRRNKLFPSHLESQNNQESNVEQRRLGNNTELRQQIDHNSEVRRRRIRRDKRQRKDLITISYE